MCGIAGVMGTSVAGGKMLERIAQDMGATLNRRGPDSDGVWFSAEDGVALAHRRLAILDLSPTGHQPMRSENHRYTVTYNGEIYNHLELRAQLERCSPAPCWKGSSDTETLLAAITIWGLQVSLDRIRGMFAFGLWDSLSKTLTLVRDNYGEKPLYFGECAGLFAFASEMKAFRKVPGWHPNIDLASLDHFTRNSHIPAPYTIYRGVSKLEPGSLIVIGERGKARSSIEYFGGLGRGSRLEYTWDSKSDVDAENALDGLLRSSVKSRMQADVPLGALFSGGIDSTTIVAVMKQVSQTPIQTFTVGFEEEAFDESTQARDVARHLGTDHHEIIVKPSDALKLIPKLATIWDEPFGDPSQIPAFFVSEFARRHVTVALSGDGGDELFCGYKHYALGNQIYNLVSMLAPSLRCGLSSALYRASQASISRSLFKGEKVEKLARLSEVLRYKSITDFYRLLIGVYAGPSLVPGASQLNLPCIGSQKSFIDEMMGYDLRQYLPENILVKADRASMANSLELRAPFLDTPLIDFARGIPLNLKYRKGVTKWLLRQVLYKYVPRHLVDRPKQGFTIPLGMWLKGELNEWARDLLSSENLRKSNVFDANLINRLWHEQMRGDRRRQRVLWNVLMFQSWWLDVHELVD